MNAGKVGLTRMLAYAWAMPTTAIGLVFALPLLALGARARCVQGVLEIYGGWLVPRLATASGFAAVTLGHVVIGVSASCLSTLRAHEHVHVRQAERWGLLFIPAYMLASVWQVVRGRHMYYDNPFEREAFKVDTCNQHLPT